VQVRDPMNQQQRIDRFVSEIGRAFYAPVNQLEIRMAYEQKDNSGAVFVNDRKEQDSHPDRAGTAMIGGVSYWVNGWLKKTKDGKPYLSLSFKPKTEKANPPVDLNDSIPF
jgi:hypothetical protein